MITLAARRVVKRRVEREQELARLALAVVRSSGVNDRNEWLMERKWCVADLLVFLDVLSDTPQAKRAWIEGR